MTNKKTLASLDNLPEDLYALHGSAERHTVLFPAQPDQGHLIEEYNRLAVYGTLSVEVALLYAVIRAPSTDWGWRFIPDAFRPHFLVVGPTRLQISRGYVHLLNRGDFQDFVLDGLACLAYKTIMPLESREVPTNILELLIARGRIRVIDYETYRAEKAT